VNCHLILELYSYNEFIRKALSNLPGRIWEDKINREEFSLALGNLSTANFEAKNYFDSRANAQVLLKCCLESLSTEKICKFNERIDQCLKLISLKQPSSNGQNLPICDSDSLCIVYDENLGRNGVALTDISFGEVLLIDEPVVVRNKAGKQFCTNCLNELNSEKSFESPVDEEALFCSLNCLVSALETYHLYESKLNFRKVFSGKSAALLSKTLLPLRLITQKSSKYFQQKMNNQTKLSPDYGCGSTFIEVEGYPCVDSMVTHYNDQSSSQLLGLAINAYILYHCLCGMEYLTLEPQLDGLNLFVTAMLYQYISAARYNAHEIDMNSKKNGTYDQVDVLSIGSALYPILPLLNHSCNANTIRFNIGKKVVLIASRDIRKGEKVTDSYGKTFLQADKQSRQQYFKAKYNFLCECDACTQDYPTIEGLDWELSEEQLEAVEGATKEINTKLVSKDYNAAIALTKELHSEMVKQNISDVHAAYQKLKIMLGTCYRLQFSIQL